MEPDFVVCGPTAESHDEVKELRPVEIVSLSVLRVRLLDGLVSVRCEAACRDSIP